MVNAPLGARRHTVDLVRRPFVNRACWNEMRSRMSATTGSATLPTVRSRVSLARLNATTGPRATLRAELLSLFQELREEGLQPATMETYGSALRFWSEFCQLMGIGSVAFGAAPADDAPVYRSQLQSEDDAFMIFLIYVVYYPRQANKDFNTASYAESCLSAVRSHYGRHQKRKPGTDGASRSYELKLLVRALHKRSPSRRVPRLPILAHHLRTIRRLLDLKNNARHRVLWALITVSWQSVSRFSDLIRGKKVRARDSWNATDMHCGRVEIFKDSTAPAGFMVRLDMPPSKNDATGEKGFIKFLPVDFHADAVSGGAALYRMLRDHARRDVDPTSIPLFLDPSTGKQMTYAYAAGELKRLLLTASVRWPSEVPAELAKGWHSLRIGGATTAANVKGSSDLIAGFMGTWSSDAKYGYFWAMRKRIAGVAAEMAHAAADDATHRHSRA